ncbi:MAG: hypothetical protein A2W91_11340 [Bacteroidetes bacterium GWF2_38_335]|nr:MAG: hypothetical protein A2W91_11340 [Bacteroidetes bacterium GWF2_38_335]OFY81709.1 MAG: hypothetical protein A2281_05700 [Bacteroidetes bacterium RIFOXYA12_FULL_38_20]HBS87773.1 DUF1801 domain-containing protein [Bacteroidales bacterium]
MAEIKTKPTAVKPVDFINTVESEQKKKDALELLKIFNDVTGVKPVMWGTSMIGYGQYHYKSKSGQEGDWFMTGFSPRKANISIYIYQDYKEREALLQKLGKCKTGVGCIYVNKLSDIDIKVLKQMITGSVECLKKIYK